MLLLLIQLHLNGYPPAAGKTAQRIDDTEHPTESENSIFNVNIIDNQNISFDRLCPNIWANEYDRHNQRA